ncbi:hypothetical protein TI05_03895 [Achromatium sp. WMS3]|nr:hypothetical protein TI05_03895 [Achromatium sp. WMS3]
MNFEDFINLLTKEDVEKINQAFREHQKPVYNFAKIKIQDLEKLFYLKIIFTEQIFTDWFNYDITLKDEDIIFLKTLLEQEKNLLRYYNEEDLKIHFISPILNRINFKSYEHEVRDFYEEFLIYETNDVILKGIADFLVAKGLKSPKNPYFFIQEFKKNAGYSDPEPQLLAELISAVELNQFNEMKGAFIIGENWIFVILSRLAEHKYHYSSSRTFNASNINDLQSIYKNLLVVKHEILQKFKTQP